MSDEPRRRDNASLPSFIWALMGILVVALFVLVLGILHPVG
jgi:hypothetical protein